MEEKIPIRYGSANIRDFPLLQEPDLCRDISGKFYKQILEFRVRSCGIDSASAPETRWLM